MMEIPKEIGEQEQLLECALKMLENIELQIHVTYEYERLKELYEHKEVVRAIVKKYQQKKTLSGCE